MKSNIKVILLTLGFLYLLCFPRQACTGVRDGLVLWYNSILPVLFPFMLLCKIGLKSDIFSSVQKWFRRPVHALLGCSGYGAFAVLIGFLCGFPMGAKFTSELKRQGKITEDEAEFLYGFVNNLSPAFIVSYIAEEQLSRPGWKGLLLLNILGSALLYGLFTSFSFRKRIPGSAENPSLPADKPQNLPEKFAWIDLAINDTIQSMVRIGAYLVIFSILVRALSQLLNTGSPMAVFPLSCLEIAGGVRLICALALPDRTKYVMLSITGAFGGLSAIMQTISLAEMNRHEARLYIKSRVMITLLSAILSISSALFFSSILLC